MSSYLVCFAIGEFDFQEKVSRGIRYRVYTPVGYAYLTTFSLDLSVKVIEYFSGEFHFIL
jgi:aminopeptidase N